MKNNPRTGLILYEARLELSFSGNRMANYATFSNEEMINRANLEYGGVRKAQMIESAAPIVVHYDLRLGGLWVLSVILAVFAVLNLTGRITFAPGTESLCG
jgi:hypothetical protein